MPSSFRKPYNSNTPRGILLGLKSYRFSFNGQEKDGDTYSEGNAYDFGARIYDSRLGRWMSMDPLQKKYPFNSPYSFCANNPIVYVDYDGRDYRYSIEIITDKSGKSYANISINTTIHAYGKDACGVENPFQIKGAVVVDFQGKQYIANVTVNVNVVAHKSKEAAEQAMVAGDNMMQVDESLTNDQMKEFNGEVIDPSPIPTGVLGNAIRGGKFANSRTLIPQLILHEALHEVGLIDRYLADKYGIEIDSDNGYEGTSMGGKVSMRYATGDYQDLAKQVLKDSEKNMRKTDSNKKTNSGIHIGLIIPESIKSSYTNEQRIWLMNLTEFIGLVNSKKVAYFDLVIIRNVLLRSGRDF